jgi:hypothetical protein
MSLTKRMTLLTAIWAFLIFVMSLLIHTLIGTPIYVYIIGISIATLIAFLVYVYVEGRYLRH